MSESSPLHLGKRERQVVEAVFRLGEATVATVLAELAEPPSYSAVRAVLNLLVAKNLLSTRQDGKRLVYRPVGSKLTVGRSALRNLVRTFFGSTPADAVAELLGGSAGKLTAVDLQRIRTMIERAECERSRER